MKKIAYLYGFDTMADWEPGYALAELNSGRFFKDNSLKFEVRTVSLTRDPITTMGGLKLLPDLTVDSLNTHDAGLLLLPGGDTWLEAFHEPVFAMVNEFLQGNIIVAAICGATMGLAAHGFLDNRRHTSNDLDYLKAICPSYRGELFYSQEPVTIDGRLITASGVASLEFARAILSRLEVFSPDTLEAWYKLHQTQETAYWGQLMASLPPAR